MGRVIRPSKIEENALAIEGWHLLSDAPSRGHLLVLTNETKELFALVSSNDVLQWQKDPSHHVLLQSSGVFCEADMKIFKYWKVLA